MFWSQHAYHPTIGMLRLPRSHGLSSFPVHLFFHANHDADGVLLPRRTLPSKPPPHLHHFSRDQCHDGVTHHMRPRRCLRTRRRNICLRARLHPAATLLHQPHKAQNLGDLRCVCMHSIRVYCHGHQSHAIYCEDGSWRGPRDDLSIVIGMRDERDEV